MSPPSSSSSSSSSIDGRRRRNNMTPAQASSIEVMNSCLKCHLCDKPFVVPATLMACMHSFCRGCILEYTEDHWRCPVEGCGASVTCKGGSREAVRNNPIISAVASSLLEIERIMATAPDDWWTRREDDEVRRSDDGSGEESGDAETMEVVDFRVAADDGDDGGKQRDGNRPDGGDHAANDIRDGGGGGWGAACAPSNDRSSFPPHDDDDDDDGEEHARAFARRGDPAVPPTGPPLPEFPCSPIAVRDSSSCPGRRVRLGGAARDDDDDDERSPSPDDDRSPSPDDDRRAPRASSGRSRRSSSSSGGVHRATTARVSFQRRPGVLLLDPLWKWKVEHGRRLRRWIEDGLVTVLGMGRDAKIGDDDDDDADGGSFDHCSGGGFDFDAEGVRESFLSMLSSDRAHGDIPPAPASFYAIGERDVNFSFEGSVVPRSFPYYLAVACGLPIVDAEFVSSVASSSGGHRGGTANGLGYPFPAPPPPGSDGTIAEGKRHRVDHLVRGASNYTWDAPKKSREAALARHSLWQRRGGPHSGSDTLSPGTDLLRGYGVILVGEFDHPNRGRRTAGKRKRRTNPETKDSGYLTRGNLSVLLQLCGARVYDVPFASSKHMKKGLTEGQLKEIEDATPLGADRNGPTLKDILRSRIEDRSSSEPRQLLVMLRGESDAMSLGKEFLSQMSVEDAEVPVVSCQWLLDSIGEFEVQEISRYWA